MSSCTEAQSSGSAVASASIFDSFSSAFSSLFPVAYADEGDEGDDDDKEEGNDDQDGDEEAKDDDEEGGDDDEDEDDEPEDPMPSIYEGE